MTLANRIAVMDHGRIRQIGTPTEVYEYPNSRFVADFVGSINMFEGKVGDASSDGRVSVDVPELDSDVWARSIGALPAGTAVTLAIRPEKIAISRDRPTSATNAIEGVVQDLGYFGKDSLYRVELPSGRVVSVNCVNARRVGEQERVAQWEDRVWLSFEPEALILFKKDGDG